MKSQQYIYNKKTINNIFFIINIILILIISSIIVYFLYKYVKSRYNNNDNNNDNDNLNESFENNKKIIIPDIIGGIGNQLFIVATAFAYSKEHNYKLMLDNRKDVFSYGKPRPTYNDTLFTKIPIYNNYNNYKKNFIKLSENKYASGIRSNTNKHIFLTDGFYQEAKYFDKYRNEILDLFEPTEDTNNKVIELCKINNINIDSDYLVAIHIRLDDVYTPIDADKRVYDKDEYDIIIQKLPEHLNKNPNTKFIIFSNDIPRTKDIFKPSQIDSSRMIYIQAEDYVELSLMTKCNDYIASPSTFNWWGIYLNKNPDKNIFIYWKQDSEYRKDFYKKYNIFNIK